MTTDWLANSNSDGSELGFGTATGSANSNFGWSSLQARLSAGGCKLTRSLNQLQTRPPILQVYCLCAFRDSPARSYQRKPASNLTPTFCFLKDDFFGTRRASIRDAVSASPQGEARISRSAPNFGCPAARFWTRLDWELDSDGPIRSFLEVRILLPLRGPALGLAYS
jgi:hypothetical protein